MFKFFTGRVKCEVLQSEESIIGDEVFSGSASIRLVDENIVTESGISDILFVCAILVNFL